MTRTKTALSLVTKGWPLASTVNCDESLCTNRRAGPSAGSRREGVGTALRRRLQSRCWGLSTIMTSQGCMLGRATTSFSLQVASACVDLAFGFDSHALSPYTIFDLPRVSGRLTALAGRTRAEPRTDATWQGTLTGCHIRVRNVPFRSRQVSLIMAWIDPSFNGLACLSLYRSLHGHSQALITVECP